MMKKRIAAAFLCIIFTLCLLCGCEKQQQEAAEDNILSVYASFYPLYAIASMVTQGVPDLQLNCLVQPQDGCLRDYQLSDWDLALLTGSADAVIVGGRGLESFENLLYMLGEEGPAVSSVLYNMELSSYAPQQSPEDSHWTGENPHIYLKTAGAIEIAERIAAYFIEIDPKYADLYAGNLEKTQNRLKSVQKDLQESCLDIAGEPVIVMNEALVYAAEELGLRVELCVERESGEAFYDEALANCLNLVSESGAKVILIEKQAPQRFCEALEEAGCSVVKLDTLSTMRAADGAEGYLAALLTNAEAIKAAFSAEGKQNS